MSPQNEHRGGILVPVDFSPSSLAALIWGARAATSFALPLEVLHVVHDPESNPGYYQTEGNELQRLEAAAGKMMRAFMEKAIVQNPDLEPLRSARRTLVVGLPVNRILEVAAQRDTRFIVMGSQGRTGLPRLLLGSKAQRVVQQSPLPVTIVKAPRDAWSGAGE